MTNKEYSKLELGDIVGIMRGQYKNRLFKVEDIWDDERKKFPGRMYLIECDEFGNIIRYNNGDSCNCIIRHYRHLKVIRQL